MNETNSERERRKRGTGRERESEKGEVAHKRAPLFIIRRYVTTLYAARPKTRAYNADVIAIRSLPHARARARVNHPCNHPLSDDYAASLISATCNYDISADTESIDNPIIEDCKVGGGP